MNTAIETCMALGWHEDLEAAIADARRRKRPILSLALLGRLDEEQSCANSRFFRMCLYPDPAISRLLRDSFVLHWRSVRRVPRVRIDFGDGRVVERTVTGNSAHVVLDRAGRPLDAIPGLLGPEAFYRALVSALESVGCAPVDHHARALGVLLSRWADDLAALGKHRSASAARAALAAGDPARATVILEAATELAGWEAIASLHLGEARLSDAARAIVGARVPTARQAGALAVTKLRVEDPVLRLIHPLQQSIAEDSVRNTYTLHRRVHERFVNEARFDTREALVSWLYADLFRMPLDDPWLGLDGADPWTALA